MLQMFVLKLEVSAQALPSLLFVLPVPDVLCLCSVLVGRWPHRVATPAVVADSMQLGVYLLCDVVLATVVSAAVLPILIVSSTQDAAMQPANAHLFFLVAPLRMASFLLCHRTLLQVRKAKAAGLCSKMISKRCCHIGVTLRGDATLDSSVILASASMPHPTTRLEALTTRWCGPTEASAKFYLDSTPQNSPHPLAPQGYFQRETEHIHF